MGSFRQKLVDRILPRGRSMVEQARAVPRLVARIHMDRDMTDERLRAAETAITRLQEQQNSTHQDLGEIKGVLLSLGNNIQDIRDAVMKATGGWKALLAVGGLAGAIGGIATTVMIAVWPK